MSVTGNATRNVAEFVTANNDKSYVDWPAIWAGAVVGSAISLLLISFGSAIGLSLTSAYKGTGMSLMAFAISAALWLVWVQVSGFFAGGYVAGRMRRRVHDATEHESDIRDGSHGVVVWGLGMLIGVMVAVSGISGTISTAADVATQVGGAAAEGVASQAGSGENPLTAAMGLPIDRFLRGGTSATTPAAPAPTPQRAGLEDPRPAIARILGSAVITGQLDPEDRAYLANTVASRTGITSDEANARVDRLMDQAKATEQQIREGADRARRMKVIAAFITAVSMLISGVAAYAGAVLGGNHRDNNYVISGWTGRW